MSTDNIKLLQTYILRSWWVCCKQKKKCRKNTSTKKWHKNTLQLQNILWPSKEQGNETVRIHMKEKLIWYKTQWIVRLQEQKLACWHDKGRISEKIRNFIFQNWQWYLKAKYICKGFKTRQNVQTWSVLTTTPSECTMVPGHIPE